MGNKVPAEAPLGGGGRLSVSVASSGLDFVCVFDSSLKYPSQRLAQKSHPKKLSKGTSGNTHVFVGVWVPTLGALAQHIINSTRNFILAPKADLQHMLPTRLSIVSPHRPPQNKTGKPSKPTNAWLDPLGPWGMPWLGRQIDEEGPERQPPTVSATPSPPQKKQNQQIPRHPPPPPNPRAKLADTNFVHKFSVQTAFTDDHMNLFKRGATTHTTGLLHYAFANLKTDRYALRNKTVEAIKILEGYGNDPKQVLHKAGFAHSLKARSLVL